MVLGGEWSTAGPGGAYVHCKLPRSKYPPPKDAHPHSPPAFVRLLVMSGEMNGHPVWVGDLPGTRGVSAGQQGAMQRWGGAAAVQQQRRAARQRVRGGLASPLAAPRRLQEIKTVYNSQPHENSLRSQMKMSRRK